MNKNTDSIFSKSSPQKKQNSQEKNLSSEDLLSPLVNRKELVKEELSGEALKIYDNCLEMHQQAEIILAEIYEKTGWTPNSLRQHLSNPNNFKDNTAWERIQKEYANLGRQLQIEPKNAAAYTDKKINSSGNRLKMKSRRNWIPMR
jgi:hypothetical protein